jgi:hypothetical protein
MTTTTTSSSSEGQAVLDRLAAASERLAARARYARYAHMSTPADTLPAGVAGDDYAGVLRVEQDTGALDVLVKHPDGVYAWHSLGTPVLSHAGD